MDNNSEKIYLLSYDIAQEDNSKYYQKIYDELDRIDSISVQQSVWLIRTNFTPQRTCDWAINILRKGVDKVLILEYDKNCAFSNLDPKVKEWIDR